MVQKRSLSNVVYLNILEFVVIRQQTPARGAREDDATFVDVVYYRLH